MSDTPNTGNGKPDGSFPATTGEFLTLYALLILVWATGSWVRKISDWTDHGFSDASIGQLVGSVAGGVISYSVMLALPVLMWRTGRVIHRHQYLRLSLGLLILGLACLGFAAITMGGGAVTAWPEWLLIALIVHPTLSGVIGLGHCILLTRRNHKRRL